MITHHDWLGISNRERRIKSDTPQSLDLRRAHTERRDTEHTWCTRFAGGESLSVPRWL